HFVPSIAARASLRFPSCSTRSQQAPLDRTRRTVWWCSVIELLTCNVRSVLRVLCGPLRLCAEYCVLLLQCPILSAKTQRTAKHAEVIKQRRIRTLPAAWRSNLCRCLIIVGGIIRETIYMVCADHCDASFERRCAEGIS